MAVSISLHNQTAKLFANKEVNLSNLRVKLLSASAAFNATHTKINQVDNGSTATFTVTIASPGVVTQNSHGYSANQPYIPTTTGALPTGLTPGTTYFVRNPTTNTFELSATSGGASINTTGSQSGTHTGFASGSYEVNGNGWPANGPTIAGVAVAIVTTNDANLTATDVVVTASGGSIGPSIAAEIFDSLTGNTLAYIDFGGSQSAGDTTDFKLRWGAGTGVIFSWTY